MMPAPDVNFDINTPQIGDQVAVSVGISDAKRLLHFQFILPPVMIKQLAQALKIAAEKAETQIVKPQSAIATA